jgi:hypothetical protein
MKELMTGLCPPTNQCIKRADGGLSLKTAGANNVLIPPVTQNCSQFLIHDKPNNLSLFQRSIGRKQGTQGQVHTEHLLL